MDIEPPTYTLRLVSPGENRLRVMMLIRELWPAIGLAQAKVLVNGGPQIIRLEVAHADRDRIKNQFASIGAVCELSRTRPWP